MVMGRGERAFLGHPTLGTPLTLRALGQAEAESPQGLSDQCWPCPQLVKLQKEKTAFCPFENLTICGKPGPRGSPAKT